MAAKKKTTTKRKTTKKKAPAKRAKAATKKKAAGVGAKALVVRVSADALAYLDANRGDRPRTKLLREILAKGDAKLGKLLGAE
jgi:hypothetical protein